MIEVSHYPSRQHGSLALYPFYYYRLGHWNGVDLSSSGLPTKIYIFSTAPIETWIEAKVLTVGTKNIEMYEQISSSELRLSAFD